jgi:hypothetical protein
MKQNFLVLTFLFLITSTLNAQLCRMDVNSPGFTQLKGSKTYYVTTGNADFDNAVIEALKTVWTITPWEILDGDKLDSKMSDKTCSFLIPESDGMILINGGKKHLYDYSVLDFLAQSPKHDAGDEKKITDCAYRVRNMIEAMIQAMDIVQKKEKEGAVGKEFRAVYNGRSPKIKDRVLLFCEEALQTNVYPDQPNNSRNFTDKGKIREKYKGILSESYPFSYEICTKEKLAQAIKDRSTEYYYFQPAMGPGGKYIFVYDPSNGQVVFFDHQMQGIKVVEKDIELLVSTIKGEAK